MPAILLLDLHEVGAWIVVGANALAGLWALGAHRVAGLRTRALWWFTALAQLAIFVQVGIGVALVNVEDIPAPEFHQFYGFVALIAVGILFSYRQQVPRHLYVLYGLGGLFLMGLGLRAVFLR